MAGGGKSGLTSHTLCPLSCGSDTPDCIGTARPYISDHHKKRASNRKPSIFDLKFCKKKGEPAFHIQVKGK